MKGDYRQPASLMRALPRQTPSALDTDGVVAYEFASFRLELLTRRLLREAVPIPLTPKAFETLLVLVRHRQRVVSKGELLTAIWPDSFVTEDSLTQNVWALRRALRDDSTQPRFIATVPRTGYRFIADAAETRADPKALDRRSQSLRLSEAQAPANVARLNATPDVPEMGPAEGRPRRHRPIAWVVVTAIVLASVVAWRRKQPGTPAP